MGQFDIKKFDKQKSLFIEASAGTGKTYTIQLMVSKLISEGVPLKEILIVTYTDKAAGELRDRIRKKMNEVLANKKIDAGNPDEKDLPDEVLALFAKASQDVDNANIFTIHSFCQKTLKEFAYDAGRPFDMGMIDESEVSDLVEQYVRDKWVNDEEFQILLQGKNTDSLVREFKEIITGAVNSYKGNGNEGEIIPLKEPAVILNGEKLSPDKIRDIAKTNFASYKDLKIFPGFEDALAFFENPSSNLQEKHIQKAIEFSSDVKKWKNNGALFNGMEFQARKFDISQKNHFSAIKEVKEFFDTRFSALQNQFLYRQIPAIFEEWQKTKKEAKCQSFNDMILSVHKAVMEGSNLKEKLRAQYRFAIIDEFQDTNQLQWDIFRTVFLKDQRGPVEEHSIFVVGDPKQSIYSFQGADVNVYQEAIGEIQNGTSLMNNFRSTNGIIESCNALFAGPFFSANDGMQQLIQFNNSLVPTNEKQQKANPQINGKEVASFWISDEDISSSDFAKTAVEKIVDWCSFTKDKETKLRVFDKEKCNNLRNVTFKDFAILARKRSEMEDIEEALRHAGVPFSRYKDSNLFNSRECSEWIALFRALNASDFSAWNRRILNEVLITDFFRHSLRKFAAGSDLSSSDHSMDELHFVESPIFDDPNNPQRKFLNQWRELALKHRYAEMLERIYEDTEIEQRLTDISKLQNLAKLRQIGNYAIEYLYNHNCSLEELIRHLDGLASNSEDTDDEDGNLVEKGTDYDAVQIMTIHASKGLEFPVVISVAGFKGFSHKSKGPFLFHDDKGIHLGLDSSSKESRQKEEKEEWKRLFYVDYTRASSILVLPRYDKWKTKTGIKAEFKFLHSSFEGFCKDVTCVDNECDSLPEGACYTILKTNSEWDFGDMKNQVKEHILSPLSKKNPSEEDFSKIENAIEEQKETMEQLQGKIPQACILQYSYSSLSGKAESLVSNEDESPIDRNGDGEESLPSSTVKNIDENALNCSINESGDCHSKHNESQHKFPRGSKLGNAIHSIFERTRFKEFGLQLDSLEKAQKDSEIINVVDEEFRNQALPIWKHKEDWTPIAISYLWHTLHAVLPTIAGSSTHDECFKLVDIEPENHKPEVQFNLRADSPENKALHRFCKGFIDLMFVRTDKDGNKRYSILDWKSDTMEEDNYTPDALKERVDKDYSIQRVLYCYCLIQWLKQFYGENTAENLTEQEIFEKHFGGIYYAFVRGTEGGTSKGIYAQTWKSFEDLKTAYHEIEKLMSKKRTK